ncbi:MAG: hypothetical protein QNI98_00980 [Woeseiaceae bacterium]|nr:hypothetical protein [Woeseiaceae bacterium]
MKNAKTVAAFTLIGLFAANVAMALPGFDEEAPQSSVDTCVAAVDAQADYNESAKVLHNVETSKRRVSGHIMSIQTLVYGQDGHTLIREYKTNCAINDDDEIKRFRIRQRGA